MQRTFNTDRFDQAVSFLSTPIMKLLLALPEQIRSTAFEVRLWVNQPIAVFHANGCSFVGTDSNVTPLPQETARHITIHDMEACMISLCDYSVHSHQNQIKEGYITVQGGHRAGICGTAVIEDGQISSLRDITSINLRIAREIVGAGEMLVQYLFGTQLQSVLLVGMPSSGKTTLLRDISRILSSGYQGRFLKIAVVDERCEIGAVCKGVPQNNLGSCCDILSGYPKGIGIMHALRTLSPQIIVCDEIGGTIETESMLQALNSGVKFIASAHGNSLHEILYRPQILTLLQQNVFDSVVLLENAETPGRIKQIVKVRDLLGQAFGDAVNCSFGVGSRTHYGVESF